MTDLREKVLDSGLLLVYGKLYLGLVRLIPSTRGLERIEGDFDLLGIQSLPTPFNSLQTEQALGK